MHYTTVCYVPSERNYAKKYKISIDDNGLLSCDCPSWVFNQRRNRTCKHIDTLRGRVDISISGKVGSYNGLPLACYSYPHGCDTCNIKFKCYTTNDIEVIGRNNEGY